MRDTIPCRQSSSHPLGWAEGCVSLCSQKRSHLCVDVSEAEIHQPPSLVCKGSHCYAYLSLSRFSLPHDSGRRTVLGDIRTECTRGRCGGLVPASLPPSYLLGPHPTRKPFQSSDLLSSGISEDQVTALVFQNTSCGVVVVGSQGQAWPPLAPSRQQIAEPYRL